MRGSKKKRIGMISLSVFIFIIVIVSIPSFSNMNDIRQIEEYAESLKEPTKKQQHEISDSYGCPFN